MSEKEYIEREALISEFKRLKLGENGLIEKIFADGVYAVLENFPTADVQEVRHGKWELIDECANEGIYCSNCHKKVYRAKYANQKVKSNYCPNCGAKMDEE